MPRPLQVTAWVPLLDVTVEHGCMQLLAGGHRTGKIVPHTCAVGDTWYVVFLGVVCGFESHQGSPTPGVIGYTGIDGWLEGDFDRLHT
jgi:hypothetical protein